MARVSYTSYKSRQTSAVTILVHGRLQPDRFRRCLRHAFLNKYQNSDNLLCSVVCSMW